MTMPTLAEWTRTPLYLVGVLAVLLGVLAYVIRRASKHTPAAVLVAAVGAVVCTAYSGDTSWNFARDRLHMAALGERSIMFAAAELGLFSMALMARQNLTTSGAPGTPGVLVWVITGVQVVPAFSESGMVGGFVRAFVGPVLAALLWHLAMGIELRHHKPGTDSQSLPAVLVREARERLLSRLGLSRRGRDAAQITRDRWTQVATRRAAHLSDLTASSAKSWRLARARRRLAVAVDRTDAGVLPEQRAVLLERLAAYRNAEQLALMALPAPWILSAERMEPEAPVVEVERVPEPAPEPVPEAHPAIERPAPAVPEVVPAGARLLPIVARAAAVVPETHDPVPEPSEYAVETIARMMLTHPELDDLDVEPDDDSPPPPAEDHLTGQARRDFLADLMDGTPPSIRTLRGRYGIGQQRATRVQSELKAALV